MGKRLNGEVLNCFEREINVIEFIVDRDCRKIIRLRIYSFIN